MNENTETQTSQTPLVSEVLAGLSHRQKRLPPKLLYDKRGSEIFEEICELDDYYPTRAEKEILLLHGAEIARYVGDDVLLIEPGSGAGEKVRLLLNYLHRPAGYVPVEISREILFRMCGEFDEEFPDLRVFPVCADFTKEVELPVSGMSFVKKVIFFPGSTIGNFTPAEAVDFLKRTMKLAGRGGGLLIGADLKKDATRLIRAYDDSEGVTAAFNLNLLHRLNREASASFAPESFYHRAIYSPEEGRVEMHLVSRIPQLVRVGDTVFRFFEGETIHTESSYKYSVEEFAELCAKAGLSLRKTWKDREGLFCVYYFEQE